VAAASLRATGWRELPRGLPSRSDKEFIAKIGVVIEEADETAFWLELLVEAAVVAPVAAKNLWKEADELTRIFVSSRETARRRRRLKRRRGQTTESNY
jgi:hypothetical protein